MTFFEMIFGEEYPKERDARRERRRLSREAREQRRQTRIDAANYGAKHSDTVESGLMRTLKRLFGG